ncbi:unnamed protein product [Adineta ricciae]|uniref:Uncharacterized protein n=1 Tax=Adineta ricciae TaxID=249248 RepID=A0A813QPL9_ADIRI|nr:unnamed protein product [Adineta ricciae]
MTSDLLTVTDQLSTSSTNLNELYLNYETLSPSNKIKSESLANSLLSSNTRKDSTLKLPYPVLSDHRNPSSILVLLQKETQTTSKKISNVNKQIEECEQRLTCNSHSEHEKKTFKSERVKLKQQLDALKKHERRVSLQIDFMTTKSEIKGLEEEYKQIYENVNSEESRQIKILLGKLKQKLDKMKIYMRARNDEMRKITNDKQRLNKIRISQASSQNQQHQRVHSSVTKDSNRKRPSTSTGNSQMKKCSKPIVPTIRLSSRETGHDSVQPGIVRFVNKTADSKANSTSPTTPGSSSSISSPQPLTINELPSGDTVDDDEDNELDMDLNIDELFDDDPFAEQTMQRSKLGMNKDAYPLAVNPNS